jgi:hypothetical protein
MNGVSLRSSSFGSLLCQERQRITEYTKSDDSSQWRTAAVDLNSPQLEYGY